MGQIECGASAGTYGLPSASNSGSRALSLWLGEARATRGAARWVASPNGVPLSPGRGRVFASFKSMPVPCRAVHPPFGHPSPGRNRCGPGLRLEVVAHPLLVSRHGSPPRASPGAAPAVVFGARLHGAGSFPGSTRPDDRRERDAVVAGERLMVIVVTLPDRERDDVRVGVAGAARPVVPDAGGTSSKHRWKGQWRSGGRCVS